MSNSADALAKYLEKVEKGKEERKVQEVDGYLIIPLERMKVKEDFIMVFQDSLLLLSGMDLTLYEWKVLAFLLGITDFENLVLVTQKEIAKKTNIQRPHVSKTLKSLEEKGFITKKKKGRENAYRLNPLVAWKGKEFNRQNLLKVKKNRDKGIRI